MVSSLFRKDYAALTARGVEFALDDVIRLNALALKAKEAEMPTLGTSVRRAIFLDGWTMREPTVAHELWLEAVARHFDMANDRVFQFVYAFALSRDADDLPDALDPQLCVRKVFAFAKKRLVGMTAAALRDALEYAIFGLDWTACEYAPAEKPKKDDRDLPRPKKSAMLGIISGMVSRRLPVSLEDAKKMSVAELCDLTLRTDVRDGKYDAKLAHTAALKDYYRAIAEVKARHDAAKAEGGAAK